jgi:hypothetical protein
MPVYRYQQTLMPQARLQKLVPGSPTVGTPFCPNYVDVTVASGSLTDLNEAMSLAGFTYVSTDPETTPAQEGTTAIGAVSSVDMRDILVHDHFLCGSTTSERLGLMGWLVQVTGTGSDMAISGEAGHPGIVDIGVGTTAAGRGAIYLGDASIVNLALSSSQNQVDLEWLVRFNSAALSSANNERFVVGFGDTFDAAAGVEMSNGVYCEFAPGTSANFQLVNSAAATRTRTNSNIAVAASTWYRIGLRMTYPGGTPTANLLINGTVRATSTANIPTLGVGIGIRMDANAGAEARYQTDYVTLIQVTAKET